jgi:hypothetical protein
MVEGLPPGARPVLGRSVTMLFAPLEPCRGAMGSESGKVELLVRYSNREEFFGPLSDVLDRIREGDQSPYGNLPKAPPKRASAQIDGLTDAQVETIFACYRTGTGPRELAQRHGVTERALRYLLRSMASNASAVRGSSLFWMQAQSWTMPLAGP